MLAEFFMKGEAGMPLTVKDILEKTFKRSFKGYDEDEVDKFLDQIIDEFKVLLEENASLKEEVKAAAEQVNNIKHNEETIMKTLVSAQKTAERIISEATHKAELIISSAESTSRERAAKTTKELAESQTRLEELRACAQGFATSFANMINAQAAYFEKTYRSYFGQEADPLGGINTDALERIDKDMAKSLNEMDISFSGSETPDDNINTKKTNDTEFAPEVSEIKDVPYATEPESESESERQADYKAPKLDEDGFMELNEINKALSEIENGNFLDESELDEGTKQGDSQTYGDFSWLYDTESKPDSAVIKDPKEEEELKSLIDEILE